MKKRATLYCLIALLYCVGCCKEQQPTTNQAEMVWKTPLTDRLTSSMNPIIYKKLVIYSAYDSSNTKHKVIAFNKETGNKIWEWKNNKAVSGYIDENEDYVKDNILVLPLSGQIRQVVAINLDNGTELWHTILPEGGSWQIAGVGNSVFHVRGNSDRMKEEIFRTDIRTGNWQSIYAAVNINAPIFINGNIHIYKNKNDRDYLAFLISKYKDFSFQETEFTLFKYDIDSNKMVYQKTLDFIDKKNTSPALAAATADKFWLEGAPVYGLNEMDCQKDFEINLPMPEPLSANMSVIGDKIFTPRTETLLCYDAKTGKYLWADDGRSSGSTKRFQVHNGVVYFASGGDGKLHAFDVETGKRIWKIESPDKKQDPTGGFSMIATIDPTTSRLYTATYVNAICYKTAR